MNINWNCTYVLVKPNPLWIVNLYAKEFINFSFKSPFASASHQPCDANDAKWAVSLRKFSIKDYAQCITGLGYLTSHSDGQVHSRIHFFIPPPWSHCCQESKDPCDTGRKSSDLMSSPGYHARGTPLWEATHGRERWAGECTGPDGTEHSWHEGLSWWLRSPGPAHPRQMTMATMIIQRNVDFLASWWRCKLEDQRPVWVILQWPTSQCSHGSLLWCFRE